MANGWHRKRTTPADIERQRQYDSTEHRKLRAQCKRDVDAGNGHCWRCGTWIQPGTAWHLGHDDNDRSLYRGIECVPCNLTTAARKGAATVNGTTRHAASYDIRM